MNRKEQISLLIAICNQLEANQVLIEKISKLVDEHVPTEHSLAGKKMPVFITIADYAREHDITVDINDLEGLEDLAETISELNDYEIHETNDEGYGQDYAYRKEVLDELFEDYA